MATVEIASTLHFIQDSGVDTGDIISMQPIPLLADKSYLFNVLNLYAGGCDQISQAVAALEAGQPLTAQRTAGAGGVFQLSRLKRNLAAFVLMPVARAGFLKALMRCLDNTRSTILSTTNTKSPAIRVKFAPRFLQ